MDMFLKTADQILFVESVMESIAFLFVLDIKTILNRAKKLPNRMKQFLLLCYIPLELKLQMLIRTIFTTRSMYKSGSKRKYITDN